MRLGMRVLSFGCVVGLLACSKAEPRQEDTPKKTEPEKSPLTAMDVILQVHDSIEADCGKNMPKFDPEVIEKLEFSEKDRESAEQLLETLGLMAQQCSDYNVPSGEKATTCNPDCSWCPVKWYWCIENAGACAGGDNKACCKLGACGSKHHCKEVCESSCGCDVPPLPPDSGGGGDED